MPKESDFFPTMRSFVTWFFRTLDPKFVEGLCRGRPIEEAADEVLDGIIKSVRGNRGDDEPIYAADYGAIMDRIAAMHLRVRHGEESVSKNALPL